MLSLQTSTPLTVTSHPDRPGLPNCVSSCLLPSAGVIPLRTTTTAMAGNNPEPITEVALDTVNELADRDVDSVDSSARYAAYGARLRTALRASHRYLAYVSIIASLKIPM